MNIAIDPAATKILDTLNKSATVRGIQEDCATLKVLGTKAYKQAKILAVAVKAEGIRETIKTVTEDPKVVQRTLDMYEEEIRTEAENERRSNEETK